MLCLEHCSPAASVRQVVLAIIVLAVQPSLRTGFCTNPVKEAASKEGLRSLLFIGYISYQYKVPCLLKKEVVCFNYSLMNLL